MDAPSILLVATQVILSFAHFVTFLILLLQTKIHENRIHSTSQIDKYYVEGSKRVVKTRKVLLFATVSLFIWDVDPFGIWGIYGPRANHVLKILSQSAVAAAGILIVESITLATSKSHRDKIGHAFADSGTTLFVKRFFGFLQFVNASSFIVFVILISMTLDSWVVLTRLIPVTLLAIILVLFGCYYLQYFIKALQASAMAKNEELRTDAIKTNRHLRTKQMVWGISGTIVTSFLASQCILIFLTPYVPLVLHEEPDAAFLLTVLNCMVDLFVILMLTWFTWIPVKKDFMQSFRIGSSGTMTGTDQFSDRGTPVLKSRVPSSLGSPSTHGRTPSSPMQNTRIPAGRKRTQSSPTQLPRAPSSPLQRPRAPSSAPLRPRAPSSAAPSSAPSSPSLQSRAPSSISIESEQNGMPQAVTHV